MIIFAPPAAETTLLKKKMARAGVVMAAMLALRGGGLAAADTGLASEALDLVGCAGGELMTMHMMKEMHMTGGGLCNTHVEKNTREPPGWVRGRMPRSLGPLCVGVGEP